MGTSLALSYFDTLFWLVVIFMAAGMRLAQQKQLAFGMLNLAALCLIADVRTAIIGAVCTFGGWLLLWMALRIRDMSRELASVRELALVGAMASNAVLTVREPRRTANASPPNSTGATLAAVVLCVLIPAMVFVVYKITVDHRDFAVDWIARYRLDALQQITHGLRLIAFSYVVLRYVDAVHAIVWKNMALLDPLSFMGYLLPFHMLLCGPVNRYDEHVRWDHLIASSKQDDLFLGLNDITTGLFYKFVIAEYGKQLFFGDQLSSNSWLDTALIFVYLFFDFAGYSLIALGIGRWLGVPTPINFRAPFLATSITDFFTRWHMSLGTFVLRNIFTPIQLTLTRRWGVKNAWRVGMIALLSGWLFVGLWHRLSLTFLCYGIGMGVVVWLEKWTRDRLLKQAWARSASAEWAGRILGPIYVFVVMTTAIHFIIREIF
jgi:D-alanyl-lipoteichoic acid acyltransferase DltB (MBOAT superfamily)